MRAYSSQLNRMETLIDAIIDMVHILKYGPIINSKRNYRKMLTVLSDMTGGVEPFYSEYVREELNILKIPPYADGAPTYALFIPKYKHTSVFVLNEDYEFMYRLNDTTRLIAGFYIRL